MSANPGRYLSVCLLFVCCFVGLLAAPAAARAAAPPSSQPDGQVWVTNGRVLATAIGANGTSYIGGIFSYVGPQTGSGVALDVSSGVRDASFAMVQGSVFAVVPDGAERLLYRRQLPCSRRAPPRRHRPHPGRWRRRPRLPGQRQRHRVRPGPLQLDCLRRRQDSHLSAARPAATSPRSIRAAVWPRPGTPTPTARSMPSPPLARRSTPAATSPRSVARPVTT